MPNLTDYSALKGRRILVIADSPMNRYTAKTYLEEVGCIVREAESITDALEKLVSKGYGHLYDAILTDDQVHGMTAFEFLDAVKGIFSIKNIPIIIMVSVIGSISLQHSIIKGFDGYITKPYRRNDFLDGVARLFDEKQVDITQEREVGIKQSSDNNSIKILLVEDNEINRDFFVQLLTRIGLSCDVAVNGEEAVKAYKNDNNYDIIFMDCEMPVMNGYEATSRIRAEEEGEKHTVIIAVTGNAMKDDMERCLIAGMDDYISKPFNVEQVLKKIQKYENTI
ncbi:response regulator [Petroclostridium sp. X23]|nr:response regulator [Petroclostridium sp. X23]WHH61621.1 response regulator [Petroclostridium sp. X23]